MSRRLGRGISVLEVLIAMLVLTIAGLGVIATLTRVMVAQSSSTHQTVARLIAESKLQEAILAGPSGDWGVPEGSDITVIREQEALVGQNEAPTVFHYQIPDDPLPLSEQNESGTQMFGTTPDLHDMGNLYEVQVRIWWNSENGPSGAVERGTQSLTVSKVVYIET